jgi:hypothetical protein
MRSEQGEDILHNRLSESTRQFIVALFCSTALYAGGFRATINLIFEGFSHWWIRFLMEDFPV